MIKKIIALIILIISFSNLSNAQPPNPIETDTLSPSVTTSLINTFTSTTATMGGVVTADGGAPVLERGVVYSTTNTVPTIANTKQLIGTGTGAFSANVTGLIGGSLYYVRAYAINIVGVSYGVVRTFTTLPIAPLVSTSEILAITTSGATVGGNVLLEGGAAVTERGVVYSTTSTLPTITNTKQIIGAGAGLFSQAITGLTANTIYYLRAYATNSIGTSYGDVFVFTPGGPTLTTADAASITQTSVSIGGNVTSIGSSAVTERGIIYILGNTEPSITNNKTVIGNGLGNYTQSITGLLPGTLYSYRAYAINSSGTSFGQTKTFTTQTTISSIAVAGTSLTNAVVGNFTINFAQAISGLTAANFSLTASGLSNSAITAVTGTGTTWNVVVATGSGAGTIVLNLANSNGISPTISNTLPFAGATLTVDRVLPMVSSIQLVNPSPSNASTLQYTVVFSEPVTGLDIADFVLVSPTITDDAVTSVTGSGTTYIVTINAGTTNGTIRLDVLGSSTTTTIFDIAGNRLAADFSTGAVYTIIDKGIAPTITLQPVAAAICIGSNSSFTIVASSFVPFTYQWQVNSGSGFVNITNVAPYSNATTPTLTITGATTALNGFQYRCVTSNNSASSISNAVVFTVNALPTATITNGTSLVIGNASSINLSANTGAGLAYAWFLNGTAINGQTSATLNVVQTGSYTVQVTNASGCFALSTPSVVSALPTLTSGGSTSFCPGGGVLITATIGSGQTFVRWKNASGTTVGTNATTYTATTSGSYSAEINTGSSVETTQSVTVNVFALPTITINSSVTPAAVCAGNTILLTANGGTSYQWLQDGNVLNNATAATYTANLTGAYSVRNTDANGCIATATATSVTINALPVVAAITGTQQVCTGLTTTFASSTTGGVWSSSNTAVATVNTSGVVSGVSAGTTTIRYTVTNASGCITIVTRDVIVNALPIVTAIAGAQQVCFQSTTPFTNVTPGGVWSSNNTTAAIVNASTGIVTGTQSGTATITYAVTSIAGCVTTVNRDITVNALPLITASANPTTVSKGLTTQLNVSALGNIASFVWSPIGVTLNTNPASTTVRVNQNTTYNVTATSTVGCVNTANVVVTTKDEIYVETVNVFTPNGDGINDKFVIKNLDLYPNNKLQVFDQTGKIIYEQNNYANNWDGTVKGKVLTKDTYFYVLTVNGQIVKKATITLVR